MSRKEVDRPGFIQAAVSKRLSQGEAARRLALSVRQVKRLVRRYREQGAPRPSPLGRDLAPVDDRRGAWQSRRRKQARAHQRRPRRPGVGDLVQIDKSPHAWFEARAPRCTLIAFIDDATSALMALRLVPAETTEAYLQTLGQYLHQHGRPVALYSDKHSIFRVHLPEREHELTQFTRALKSLDIEPIHATRPRPRGQGPCGAG